MATLTTFTNLLKVRYLPPIREQLNNATILMSRIMKDSSTVSISGKTFTVPLHTSGNRTAGSGRAEGGTLPTAGSQGFEQAIVPCKYIYSGISVTGPVIAATRDNVGSMAQVLSTEIDGCVRDMKKSMNRQLHSDGRDALAYCTATNDTSPIYIDDGQGNNFVLLQAGATTCDIIATADNTTKRADSVAFTLAGSASAGYNTTDSGTVSGAVDGDYYVLEDTLGYQMMGIRGIIDDANPPLLSGGLHGLTVAANTWWVAQVETNSGTNRALTLALMQKPLDSISSNSDYTEQDVKFILCSYGVRAKYVDQLIADKRHVNTMQLDGGFTGIDFNGIPVVADPACRKNVMYYIVPETLRIFRMADFDWRDKGGSMLVPSETTDVYSATLFHYGDLGCVARNGNGLLEDIQE